MKNNFNIFSYALENPKSSIAQAVFRIRRICNRANCIIINISGGKDSSLDLDLFINELRFRKSTPPGNINITIDDFDNFNGYYQLEKTNMNMPYVLLNTLDPEIIYTDTRDHIIFDKVLPLGFGIFIKNGEIICGYEPFKIEDFDNLFSYWNKIKSKSEDISLEDLPTEVLNKINPEIIDKINSGSFNCVRKYDDIFCIVEGEGLLHTFYKCLPIAYQDVSAFSSEEGFISWNEDKRDFWVTSMPTKDLIGCDPIIPENWKNQNIIASSLAPKWTISEPVFINGVVGYQNWGFGCKTLKFNFMKNRERICGWSYFGQSDEGNKMSEVYTFSRWLLESTPDEVTDIYTENGNEVKHDFDFYSIVSIRGEESPNRNIILKQSNYYNANYGYISKN